MYVWPHTDNLISLDGTVGLAFRNNKIEMTDFGGGPAAVLPETWKTDFPFGRVAVSPNGKYLAATQGVDQRILIWDLQNRQQIGSLASEFMVGPASVYFSPDNRRVVAAGVAPWSILVFDLESQQQVLALASVADTRRWARFSPDGNIIAAEDEASVVYGWRAPSWEQIAAAEAAATERRTN